MIGYGKRRLAGAATIGIAAICSAAVHADDGDRSGHANRYVVTNLT